MTRLVIVALALAVTACDGSASSDADLAATAAKIRAMGYNCREDWGGFLLTRTAEHADFSKTYKFTCAGGVAYRIDIQQNGSQRLSPWPES